MTIHIPPAHSSIAAPLNWETATVEDLWYASDLAGASSCSVLAAMQQLGRLDAEHVCDSRKAH